MNINQINSGNFSEKDIKKSQKSRTSGPEKGDTVNKASSKEVPADRFTPSGTKMSNEYDLAASELAKLRDASFASLRNIKKKIEAGAYDNQEVHKKISALVEKDLNSLDQILSKMPGSEGVDTEKKTLAPEYKKYLIENPRVIQKVADQVAADLKKL
jgi:hypothetical protein